MVLGEDANNHRNRKVYLASGVHSLPLSNLGSIPNDQFPPMQSFPPALINAEPVENLDASEAEADSEDGESEASMPLTSPVNDEESEESPAYVPRSRKRALDED